jgi:hypothetical protein
MPTHQKTTKISAILTQMRTKLFLTIVWHIWIILCHHLVCFFANQIHFPISNTNSLVWAQREIIQEWNWSSAKNSPFSHNQNSPPQETKFCNKSILDKSKVLTLLFSKFTSGSWSICFGLNFYPFGIKHQKGNIFWPFNPIASPKMSIKSKKATRA